MTHIYGQPSAWKPIIDRMLPFVSRKADEMNGSVQFERVGGMIVALCTDSKYMIVHKSGLEFDDETMPDGKRVLVPKSAFKQMEPWGSGSALPVDDSVEGCLVKSDYVDKYDVDDKRKMWVERQTLLDILKLARPFFSAEIGFSCIAESNQLSMGIWKHFSIGSKQCPVQFQAEMPCSYAGEFAFSVNGEHLYQYVKNSPNRDVSFCISSKHNANIVDVDYHPDSSWRFILCPFVGSTWVSGSGENGNE